MTIFFEMMKNKILLSRGHCFPKDFVFPRAKEARALASIQESLENYREFANFMT